MTDETDGKVPCAYTLPMILALVGAGLFVALLTRQSTLTFLCMLVLAMAAGAKAWSRFSFSGIQCDMHIDKRSMFPAETITLNVGIENNKLLPVWLQVEAALGGAMQTETGEALLKENSGLLWYQRIRFSWRLRALKRGVHRIGPAALEVGDLLGFYTQIKQTPEAYDVIVYPRLAPLNPVRLPRRDFFGIPGAKSPIEDPIYIHGIRDYGHLRSARYIHWKASARYSRLMEKVCEPAEREKILMLICVDGFGGDATGESFERSLEVAASLAVHFDRMRFAMGLVTNGRLKGGGRAAWRISRSPHRISGILETLARLEPVPAGDMATMLRRGLTLSWGVTAVCFVYRLDGSILMLNQYFKDRSIPLVMIVCDPGADWKVAATRTHERIYRMEDLLAKEPAVG